MKLKDIASKISTEPSCEFDTKILFGCGIKITPCGSANAVLKIL